MRRGELHIYYIYIYLSDTKSRNRRQIIMVRHSIEEQKPVTFRQAGVKMSIRSDSGTKYVSRRFRTSPSYK